MLSAITQRGYPKEADGPAAELALCRRISAGERHLFSRLVDRYGGFVASVVAAHGVERADLDDCVQAAFVAVYKGLAGFRGEAALSSWIYRIAANTARAQLKRYGRRPAPASLEAALEAGAQPADSRLAERGGWVENAALRTALLRLSPPQRLCICLYYFEELEYAEVAAALRLPLNTVRTHLRRGKLRLAELLGPEDLH